MTTMKAVALERPDGPEQLVYRDVAKPELRIDRDAIQAFAVLSDDHSPIHTDPAYARRAGLRTFTTRISR